MKQFIEASAGTGKTFQIMEILAGLVRASAKNSLETNSFQNVLSKTIILTFTEKAAGELMDRLRKKIEGLYFGSFKNPNEKPFSSLYARYLEEWEEVTATTIHGFCFQVLSEFPVETDSLPGTKISDLAEFVEAELHSLMKSEWNGEYDAELVNLLKKSDFFKKDNGKDKVLAAVKFLLKPKYSNWEPPEISTPEETQFLQATSLVLRDRILAKLNESQFLTYDEMIRKVAVGLEKNQKLKSALLKRYDICLLDEFQDTDNLQYKIFRTLFSGEGKSFYCIGDPKQSIYSFRGGDLGVYFQAKGEIENAKDFQQKNPLSINFRSVPNLIEGYNFLFKSTGDESIFPINEPGTGGIEYKTVDFPKDKDSKIRLLATDKEAPIHIVTLSDTPKLGVDLAVSIWNQFICKEIKKIIGEGLSYEFKEKDSDLFIKKTINYRDIAILVQGKRDGTHLEEELRKAGIPCSYYKRAGIYNSEEASQLSAILSSIINSENPKDFKKLLYTELFGIPANELIDYEEFSIESKEKILIDQWRRLIRENNIPELFRRIEEDSRIFFTEKKPDLLWERRRTNYRQILQKLLEFWNVNQASYSEILAELSRLRNQKKSEEELPLFDKETEKDAVQILTMHVSKGLEWPVVFYHHLRSYSNKHPVYEFIDDSSSRSWNISLWGESTIAKSRHKEGSKREAQRLFYVALTRPMIRLYLPDWKGPSNSSYFKFILNNPIQQARQSGKSDLFAIRSVENNSPTTFPMKTNGSSTTVSPSELPTETLTWENPDIIPENYLISSYSKLSKKISANFETIATRNIEDTESSEPDLKSEPNPESEIDTAYPELISSASMGEYFHSILELIPFVHFDQPIDKLLKDSFTLTVLEHQRIDKHLKISEDKRESFYHQSLILLQNSIRALVPLADGKKIALKDISKDSLASESEFFLKFAETPEGTKGALLTGKVDLIFEANGLYYIVDYKSNQRKTSEYESSEALTPVVEESYLLQKEIYSVALFEYLKARIGEKNALEKFGGVLYLFLRGMRSGESKGIYFDNSIYLQKNLDLKKQIFADLKESVYNLLKRKFHQTKHIRKIDGKRYKTFGKLEPK